MTTLTAERTILLIGDIYEGQWPLVLQQALTPLGALRIIAPDRALTAAAACSHAVLLIDAGAVTETAALTTRLHQVCPDAPIIVLTTSPTWRRARQVMKAGAVDYMRKSLDTGPLYARIKTLLTPYESAAKIEVEYT